MASQVFFTSNPADYTQLESLYVTERKPPGFIKGRPLRTVGMAGKCVRGPTTKCVDITNPQRFLDVFGGRDYGSGGTLVGEIWAALLNKPFGKLKVRRVAAAGAALGTVNLSNVTPTAIVRVDASSVGAWSTTANGGPTVAVEDASDGVSTHFNLRLAYQGKERLLENLNTQSGADNLTSVLGDDDANWVTLTKLANGRPLNAAAVALAGGTEGSIAASDYTTGITAIANAKGVSICLVPELGGTQATLNATIVTLAASATDRLFLAWSAAGNSVSTEEAALEAQITTRSDRIVWCYNRAKTIDPTTGLKIFQGPHVWMAAVLANTDVDIHPGAHETAKILAGISELEFEELDRDDLIDLKAAGISTLEKLDDGEGFQFRSGVTTSLETGLTEITRRRMTDFLQLSAADELKFKAKSKNTRIVRAEEAGLLLGFCQRLQRAGRVIDETDADLGPGFLVDQTSVNTGEQRGQGLEFILWRVRLVGHQLYLVLLTEIGTGLTIEAPRAAAA
jgi:hypothetical protein